MTIEIIINGVKLNDKQVKCVEAGLYALKHIIDRPGQEWLGLPPMVTLEQVMELMRGGGDVTDG